MSRWVFLPLLCIPLLAANVARAEDWNQWRGPRRDGVAADLTEGEWPQELELVWVRKVGGGISGPVVEGDTVFIHSRRGTREIVSAFGLASGELLWSDAYDALFDQRYDARSFGDGPYATPVVADGTLFTYDAHGVLTAYDARSGKRRWRVDFWRRLLVRDVEYGVTASPLLVDGKCIVQAGGLRSGGVVAVDATTGETVWSFEGDHPGYASPVLATIDGYEQVITQTQVNAVGLDAKTGELLWKIPYRAGDRNNIVTPVVIEDRVILSGYHMGIEARRIARGRNGWTATRLWHTREVWSFLSTPVAMVRWLYGYSDTKRGRLYTLDSRTGALVWSSRGRMADHANLIATPSAILVLAENGTLTVYRRERPVLETVASYTVAEEETWAHPAVSNGYLIVKDTDNVSVWRVGSNEVSVP